MIKTIILYLNYKQSYETPGSRVSAQRCPPLRLAKDVLKPRLEIYNQPPAPPFVFPLDDLPKMKFIGI
jgi:hypothetical protein